MEKNKNTAILASVCLVSGLLLGSLFKMVFSKPIEDEVHKVESGFVMFLLLFILVVSLQLTVLGVVFFG